jgi:hypothetical protein
MKLVNFDSASDQKRGCLSLVFRAYDTVEEAEVALKFYDLDPGLASDMYRLASFHRECEILSRLLNVARCLQIVKAMGSYNLVIDLAPGSAVTLGCRYFAVEWIADRLSQVEWRLFAQFANHHRLRMECLPWRPTARAEGRKGPAMRRAFSFGAHTEAQSHWGRQHTNSPSRRGFL